MAVLPCATSQILGLHCGRGFCSDIMMSISDACVHHTWYTQIIFSPNVVVLFIIAIEFFASTISLDVEYLCMYVLYVYRSYTLTFTNIIKRRYLGLTSMSLNSEKGSDALQNIWMAPD
jgi:hypothetical protein